MLKTMLSEWTKLRTTKSLWWTTGLAILLPVFFTGVSAALDSTEYPLYAAAIAAQNFLALGLIPLMIQAAMVVTTEYRYNVNSINFAITPRRWQVALAKLVVYGLIAAVITLVTLVVSYTVGDALAPNPINWTSDIFARRALWALPLLSFIVVLLVQGLGWIIRATAGVVVIVLALPIIETILAFIPKIGTKLQFIAPFQNMTIFALNTPPQAPNPFGGDAIGVWGAFGIVVVWAVVVYCVGLLLLERRDA